MKFLRKSLTAKLTILFIALLVFTVVILGVRQVSTVTQIVENESLQKAKSDMQMALLIMDLEYPGDWTIENNQLVKGTTVMNNNNDFIDQIGVLTNGDTVTLFQHDIRVATNVTTNTGERAVGTKVSDAVATEVLEKGEVFFGVADVLGKSYQAAYNPLKNSSGDIVGIIYIGAPDSDERITTLTNKITYEIIIDSILVLIVASIVLFLFMRPIIGRLRKSVSILREVESGNLLIEVPNVKSYDEVDQILIATGNMKNKLYDVVTKLSESTSYVTGASEQLMESANQTTKASEQIAFEVQQIDNESVEQRSSVDHGLVSVNEIASGMRQSTEVIQSMADYASEMSLSTEEGKRIVDTAVINIQQIGVDAGETAKDINQLHQFAMEIREIITLITEISNQTQLLALNAAIEAARAGEAGHGFNVVAVEIRKLADQSIQSTEKIRELIETIQEQSDKSVARITSSEMNIRTGISNVTKSGHLFNDMATAIGTISSQSEEIVAIVQEVHATTEQMVDVMNGIKSITESTTGRVHVVNEEIGEQSASMEEVSAATVQMNELANKLKLIVAQFKI